MFQGKFAVNQIQARGDMKVALCPSSCCPRSWKRTDRCQPVQGSGLRLTWFSLPPSQNHNTNNADTFVFLQFHVGKMLPRQCNYNIALIAANFSLDMNQGLQRSSCDYDACLQELECLNCPPCLAKLPS